HDAGAQEHVEQSLPGRGHQCGSDLADERAGGADGQRRTGQDLIERRDCDALDDDVVETVRMTDVEGRSDARVTEDRDAAGGLEHVIGPTGIGDEDEYGYVEDRIQSRADGTHLGLL